MKGMSAITRTRFVARDTAAVWLTMSSMVTGRVEECPSIVMPSESPTRIASTPASSTMRAEW